MNRCPKIGDRVKYPGGLVVGQCVGVVTKIYVKHEWDEDQSDRWNALYGKPLPEREWHVAMRPDVIPVKWAYTGSVVFAPTVDDLEPADEIVNGPSISESEDARRNA
jgi:hypothetical protein